MWSGPTPQPGAVADCQPAPPADSKEMYQTRTVSFLGHRTPIVCQNDNGPCPLLAICNVLLLKNVISLNPDASEVSQEKLLSLVAERLIDSHSAVQGKDEEYVRNRERNVAEAIDLLPRLTTGIDVNVMFRKIDDFEFTRERAIFDLLDIPLYHGWIVDQQDTETAAAIGSRSYNALASGLAEFKLGELIEESKHVEEETVDFAAATTAALGVPSPSVSRGRSFDEHTLSDPVEPQKRRGDCEEKEELMRVLNVSKAEAYKRLGTKNMAYENQEPVYEGEVVVAEKACKVDKSNHFLGNRAVTDQWHLIDNFLRKTPSQLTVHGLFCLQERLNEGELCVFFRKKSFDIFHNNYFNTMFKYNGSLYLLVVDKEFISQTDLLWQKLAEDNEDGVFLTSNFTPLRAKTPRDLWNEQQFKGACDEKCLTHCIDRRAGDTKHPVRPLDKGASDEESLICFIDKGVGRNLVGRAQSEEDAAAAEAVEGADLGIVGDDTQVCSDEPFFPAPDVDAVCVFSETAGQGQASKDLYTLHPVGNNEDRVYTLPTNFYRMLKSHQQGGLKWLWETHCIYPGGIIADDMGLGKTLQTSIFLSGLFHSNIVQRAIIIAPVSILDSWLKELKRAGLEGRTHLYNSSRDRGLQMVIQKGGILLTSYNMYSSNHNTLGSPSKKWDYVVLDEAHTIKNLHANVTKSMKSIQCDKKVLMTGTPLLKDLMDVYSLMEFIQPGLLGDLCSFHENYMCPVQLGQYANSTASDKREYLNALADIREIISPYMLRRTKALLTENGELSCKKHDMIIWLRLTELQVDLYTRLCKLYHPNSNLLQHEDRKSFIQTKLSQDICVDPSLLINILDEEDHGTTTATGRVAKKLLSLADINDAVYSIKNSSSKISFILDLIKQLFEEERIEKQREETLNEGEKQGMKKRKKLKILIFSQHIHILDRLQEDLKCVVEEGDVTRIDGSVPKNDRDAKIQKFTSEDGPTIFLLSARVGGEGLNLTAATRVIIVDPSWNISDDNQIADRVYRLGQTEDVFIYRLFTCSTIEEHAYKIQLIKGTLAKAVIDGTICPSLVKKEDSTVLSLPRRGFNSSKMQKFLKSMIGDMLQLDHKHELFLKQHNLVAGITDQNRVLSQKETLLESVWCGRLRSCPPRKNKDAVPKQLDPFPVIEKFQIEVPANKVDILTGKFGDTIKRIRMQSATKIDVLKKCTRDNRTPVEIYGTLREFNKAQQLIKEVISKADETPVEVLSSDAKESDIVYVPNDMIGLIIGKKGERVRKMQQRSGARINQIGKENRFRITGTAEAVGSAKASMLEFINEVFSQRAGSTGDPGATGLGSYGVHGNIQTPRPTQQGNQAYKGSGALAQPVPHRPPGSYSYPGPTYQSMQPQRAVLSPGFRSGPPGCYYYPRPAQPPMLPLHEPSPGFRSEYSQRHCKPPQDVQSLAVRSEYYGERGPRLEYHFIPPRSYHEVGQLHQSPRPPQQYHDFIPPPSYHQVGQLHQGPRPPQQYHGFIPPPCYHEVGQLHQSPRPPQQYHDPRLTGCGRYHPRGIVNQGQGGQQLPRPPQLDNESKGQMHHK